MDPGSDDRDRPPRPTTPRPSAPRTRARSAASLAARDGGKSP